MHHKRLLVLENQSWDQKNFISHCLRTPLSSLPLSSVNRKTTGGWVACSSSETGQGKFDDSFQDGLGCINNQLAKKGPFSLWNLLLSVVHISSCATFEQQKIWICLSVDMLKTTNTTTAQCNLYTWNCKILCSDYKLEYILLRFYVIVKLKSCKV